MRSLRVLPTSQVSISPVGWILILISLKLGVFHFPRLLYFDFSTNETYIAMLKKALSLHPIDSMDPTNSHGVVRVS